MNDATTEDRTSASGREARTASPTTAPEELWRTTIGRAVRSTRHDREERLVDTARRAGVSPQYLSEVERGLKDPSSEMLAAIAGAMDLSVLELVGIAAGDTVPTRVRTAVQRPSTRSVFALAA